MNGEATKSLTGMQQYPTYIRPFQESLQQSSQARGEMAGLERGMETSRAAEREQARADVEQTYAGKVAGAPQRGELAAVSEKMEAPFIPTKETAGDMAQLFALINIAGFAMGAGGKRNAQAAMSGMNGMLEGYQQGRQDLYKREKDAFDTNLKQLKMRYDTLDRQLKEALETYKTDKQAGLQKADMAYAQAGADFYKKYADKFGLAAMYEYHKQAYDNANKMWTETKREEERADRSEYRRLMAEASAARAESAAIRAAAAGTGTGKGAGGVSGPGGAIQFRYNAAMTNAGNQLAMELQNAATLPLRATPPAAAEVLTNPSKGLTDSAKAFFAQKITEPEARAMQQVFAGMQRAITTIEASGRPSGATEGAIKEFGKTMPRAGDAKINTYLFLAQAKQVMEILVKDLKAAGGTPEQIGQAEAAKKDVGGVINWTVQDINRILSSGGRTLVDPGVQGALSKSQNLNQLNKELKAKPTKAKANPGEEIFEDASGNRAVRRGNQWVEVE